MQFNYNNTLTAFSCVLYIFFYWLKDFKAKKYAIFNYKCLSHLTLLFAAISLSLYYSNKSAHSVTAFILEFILNFSVFLLYFGNSSFATHMFVCLFVTHSSLWSLSRSDTMQGWRISRNISEIENSVNTYFVVFDRKIRSFQKPLAAVHIVMVGE